MSWLKKLGKIGWGLAPLLTAFGVPFAGSIIKAVDQIREDPDRPNDDAIDLLAASVDDHERRLAIVEKKLGIDRSKDPFKKK